MAVHHAALYKDRLFPDTVGNYLHRRLPALDNLEALQEK